MKTKNCLMTLLLGAALTATAGQPTNNVAGPTRVSASAQTQNKMVHVVNPLVVKAKVNHDIQRDGTMSSQPWMQIAVQSSRAESGSFVDLKTHDATMDLFWIGAEPQR